MSILVVCPGCRKSFKVSDKFAGKSGGCPNCRTTIRVPTKAEEVKVHAPEQFAEGGRSATGKLITKPIARRETRLQPLMAVAVGGGTLIVLLVSWAAGELIRTSLAIRVLGLLLVSPPLVLGAYSFLRDDELEPYQGTGLYVRSAVCAASYAALWGVYGYFGGMVLTGDLWQWFFVAPPLMVAGALVALGCLDLSFGNGFLHYTFYVLAIILLRWTAGMGWIWEVGDATAL